jgi:hypothetical protein
MNKIYLDYNIIVRLMNKNEPRLEEIIFSIDRTKFQLVYSPAHIEEMAVSTKRNNYPFEKTKEKLAFLSALTNNTEILPFRRNDVRVIEDLGAYLCEEHPESCYSRVSENYINNDLAEKIEADFLDEATEANIHDNDPNVMNNINPEAVLSKPMYDHQIKENFFNSLLLLGKYTKDDIQKLIGGGSNFYELTFPSIKKDYQVIETAMQLVFNKLEEIRYRPEKKKNFRSRLHDVSHATYAAYCDYFITEDSKLFDKTKAAYAYLKQETTITNIEGLRSIVSN